MKRSIILIGVLAVGVAAAWYSVMVRRSRPGPSQTSPLNLILVTVDTLRADRVGANGGPAGLTPNLDRLAKQGAVFLDATAHVPLTVPSHASILTGRYPMAHGVRDNAGFRLPASIPTLAEILRARGFQTAAFLGAFVLNRGTGLSRGFDVYRDEFAVAGLHPTLTALERRGSEVAAEAAEWMRSRPEPFFLWAHFYDPHAPYDAPPAFAKRWPGRPYDAEVAASDWALGDLLKAVPPAAMLHTLIVVTGDHGESLGEHGEDEHGIFVYDSTLHVPMVFSGPGIPSGRALHEQVRHVDIVPTVLELLGVPEPASLDGISLMTWLRDGRHGNPPPSYAESWFGQLHFGWSGLRAIRDGDWKYIEAPEPELYNLRSDPREARNQAATKAQLTSRMAGSLAKIVDQPSLPVRARDVDPATADRLRSLGYVSGTVSIGPPSGAKPSGDLDPKNVIRQYAEYVSTFNGGLGALDSGNVARAEQEFRTLARNHPASFEAYQYLGRSLAARGEHRRALVEFDRAIRLSPQTAMPYFDAARSLAAERRFDDAFARVTQGLDLDAGSFYGSLVEGLVAREAGSRDRALGAFTRALAANAGLAVAHYELGALAEEGGDRKTAAAHYRAAVTGDPSLVEARQALQRVESR